MAEKQQVTGKAIMLTSLAGIIIGGPLIGLMALTFMITTTLLLLISPLLLIFSPVLFGAVCVLGFAMLGFATAGAMAVVGVSVAARVIPRGGGGDVKAVEGIKDWGVGGYHHDHVQEKSLYYNNPVEAMVNHSSG